MKNGYAAGKGQNPNRKKNNRSKGHDSGKQNSRNLDYLAEARQKARKEQENRLRAYPRDRPRWAPPKTANNPIPAAICPVCNKPIKELASAFTDKNSGIAAHFDCIREKVAANESLGQGDAVAYIGGGRFGIVHYEGQDKRVFKIKKIIEWELTENRADWRDNIADHFSLT